MCCSRWRGANFFTACSVSDVIDTPTKGVAIEDLARRWQSNVSFEGWTRHTKGTPNTLNFFKPPGIWGNIFAATLFLDKMSRVTFFAFLLSNPKVCHEQQYKNQHLFSGCWKYWWSMHRSQCGGERSSGWVTNYIEVNISLKDPNRKHCQMHNGPRRGVF